MDSIYLITCSANKMFYIGRTSLSLSKRLDQHLQKLRCNKHNKKFQNCYNKYKAESFYIQLIAKVPTAWSKYIEEYLIKDQWKNKKLLNCSLSGCGGHTTAGYSEKQLLNYKAKLSFSNTGANNPFYNRQHTEASKQKQSKARLKYLEDKLLFSAQDIFLIRKNYINNRESYGYIAKQYKISRSHAAEIIKNKTYIDKNYTYLPEYKSYWSDYF